MSTLGICIDSALVGPQQVTTARDLQQKPDSYHGQQLNLSSQIRVSQLLDDGFLVDHTPAGLLLLSALISEFFSAPMRRLVFLSLLGGAALHLFLDLFQKHSGGGYYRFFPFSWRKFEFGLIAPDASLYLLPVWLSIGVFLAVRSFLLNEQVQKDKVSKNA
jgi:hypothetical protein